MPRDGYEATGMGISRRVKVEGGVPAAIPYPYPPVGYKHLGVTEHSTGFAMTLVIFYRYAQNGVIPSLLISKFQETLSSCDLFLLQLALRMETPTSTSSSILRAALRGRGSRQACYNTNGRCMHLAVLHNVADTKIHLGVI